MTAPDRDALRAQLTDLLGTDLSALDDTADLVDVGLDSIRLMTLVQRWHQAGIEIDVSALAACPTVRNWERMLAAAAPRPPQPLTVRRVEELTPRCVAVTFAAGDRFAGLVDGGTVTLTVPPETGLAGAGADRVYTGRYHPEHGELDVEMVLHGGGPGARWARRATPGARIGVAPGRPFPHPAADVDSWLAAVDETALPALACGLARLPDSVRAHVVVEVPDAAEERDLIGPAGLVVGWVHRDRGVASASLPEAAATWVAGGAAFVARTAARLAGRAAVRTDTYWGNP